MGILWMILLAVRALLLSHAAVTVENLALRQQLAVVSQSVKRPKLRPRDRVFWALLSRLWPNWRTALVIVQPATVIRWHRRGFRLFWRWKPGRPTIELEIRVLYVFIVLRHHRREVVHFNVTADPSAEWTAQQIIEAFPYEEAPCYMIRDRDSKYGDYFTERVEGMGIDEVLIAPHAPWQNPYCERMVGSIRQVG